MNRRASLLLVFSGAALGLAAAAAVAAPPAAAELSASTLVQDVGDSGAAQADQVTLIPTKDNTLFENAQGEISNGAGARLFVGNTNHRVIRRAVIEFDVAGKLPADAKITEASLTLNMSKTSSQDQPVTLHTVATEWGEGGSNAGGNEGSGAKAQDGDATWLHTFYPDSKWSKAGGDFAETPSASASVGAVGQYVWKSEQMAADVQAWLDNPDTNHGWMLIGRENEGGSKVRRTSKRFNSREHQSDVPSPKLVISYTSDSATQVPPSPTPDSPTPPSPSPTVETPTSETPTAETPTPETPTAQTPTGDYFIYLPFSQNGQ